MKVEDLFIKTREDAHYPQRASDGSIGFDVRSTVSLVIRRRDRGTIPTGIRINHIPDNCYIRIAGRSSLAQLDGLTVAGGVIDRDYWGEIYVLLFNNTDSDFTIQFGDKVAQLIFERYEIPKIDNESFVLNYRIEGFGSSGRK